MRYPASFLYNGSSLVMMPVNVSGNHWILLYAHVDATTQKADVVVYDSMQRASASKEETDAVKALVEWLPSTLAKRVGVE